MRNAIIFGHIRAYFVRNVQVHKEDILSHLRICYNKKPEYSDMPGYDILCCSRNCNILSHHALPQNIANMIFVNLLLQKYDEICFAFTATHKYIFRHTASHQGMSSFHWGSRVTSRCTGDAQRHCSSSCDMEPLTEVLRALRRCCAVLIYCKSITKTSIQSCEVSSDSVQKCKSSQEFSTANKNELLT